MMNLRRTALALALLFSLPACDSGRLRQGLSESFTTESSLAKKGAETHKSILEEVPLYDHAALAAYVSRVGARVARTTGDAPGTYRFYLLDDPEANAFAVPGGHIYVNRGLLTLLASEDELAAILGHEIAHLKSGHSSAKVRARGGANVLTATATTGGTILGILTFNPLLMMGSIFGNMAYGDSLVAQLAAGYGREQEFAADRYGAEAAANAGYTPQAAVQAIGKLQSEAEFVQAALRARGITPPPQHGIFDSHPDNMARLQAVTAQVATLPRRALPLEGDYLGVLDGSRFGLAERLGVQRGTQFYDGFHQQVMAVPQGWFVNQSVESATVAFTAPQSAATILLSSQDIVADLDPATFVQLYLSGTTLQGKTSTRHGRSAWRGTADIRDLHYEVTGWIERDPKGDVGYLLMGLRNAPRPPAKPVTLAWPQSYETFASTMRAMRSDEQALARPLLLRIKPADGRDRYTQLAVNAPLGVNAEPLLRLINGQYPKGEPSKGQRLKLVQ